MLRANLLVEAGLVNGSTGTIREIVFEEDQGSPSLPIAILIEFDNYTGPVITLRKVKVPPINEPGKEKKEFAHDYKSLFALHGLLLFIRVRD